MKKFKPRVLSPSYQDPSTFFDDFETEKAKNFASSTEKPKK